MRVPKWWTYPTVLMFGVGYSLCMMWIGASEHDCPVTVEYVASDTIPPVVKGWIIDGETISSVTFDSYGITKREVDSSYALRFEQAGDSCYIRPAFYMRVITQWFTPADVYADSNLAVMELCRRLDAQADDLRKKREKVQRDD